MSRRQLPDTVLVARHFASLRRALVDEGLLLRPQPGHYWRQEMPDADPAHFA